MAPNQCPVKVQKLKGSETMLSKSYSKVMSLKKETLKKETRRKRTNVSQLAIRNFNCLKKTYGCFFIFVLFSIKTKTFLTHICRK